MEVEGETRRLTGRLASFGQTRRIPNGGDYLWQMFMNDGGLDSRWRYNLPGTAGKKACSTGWDLIEGPAWHGYSETAT